MHLSVVLPREPEIDKRGGPGHEAWGHPLEPAAQYNHMTPGRVKPPICPWRVEIGDQGQQPRTLFLHVFEITDDQVLQATDVTFLPPAGVRIGNLWTVSFAPTGPLGGIVQDRPLTTSINTAAQYP